MPSSKAAQLMATTLTGVDEHTDLDTLIALSRQFPFVEWGVLYSPNRAGQGGRYPAVPAALEILRVLQEANVATAVHLCGAGVPGAIDGSDANALALAALAGRVQLNFNQTRQPLDLEALDDFIDRWGKPTITQFNQANAQVHLGLSVAASLFHQVLFDASGGRGSKPDEWPTPLPGIPCGFAGGLGPANVRSELERIHAAAQGHRFWIDMETSLRNPQDAFDLGLCEQVLRSVDAWRRG